MGKKGNILGDPFKDFVRKQINQRQESLGKYTNIEDKDLLYYNSKTPWLRLASSIDIKSDSQPAKDYILQGGVVNYTSGEKNDNLTPMKSGIGVGGAYQFLEGEDRGNVPLPGITSADVKHENRGTLTTTTVKIKCFSSAQLDIIDKLYLRPGFSMLLEFGWSVYLDNNGILKTFDEFTTPPLDFFMKGGDKDELFKKIGVCQRAYGGNYNAILGVVTNFSWEANHDGSYDCMIEMTGMGSVIESISAMSKISTNKLKEVISKYGEIKSDKDIILQQICGFNYDHSLLHLAIAQLFWAVYYDDSVGIEEDAEKLKLKMTKTKEDINSIRTSRKDPRAYHIMDVSNENIFISFGLLLDMIEDNLLRPFGKANKDNKYNIVKFRKNSLVTQHADENYISKHKNTFSSNPQICYVPPEHLPKEEEQSNWEIVKELAEEVVEYYGDKLFTKFQQYLNFATYGQYKITPEELDLTDPSVTVGLSDVSRAYVDMLNRNLGKEMFEHFPYSEVNNIWEKDKDRGRLMNIMVNTKHIIELLNSSYNKEDGSISILEFLQTLLTDISNSLGGVNNIRVGVDEGEVYFIEETPKNLDTSNSKDYSILNIHGIIPNTEKTKTEGSFVKSTNIKSEIPKDFYSMISIPFATGTVTTNEKTTFTEYNDELTDRIIGSPSEDTNNNNQTKRGSSTSEWGYAKLKVEIDKVGGNKCRFERVFKKRSEDKGGGAYLTKWGSTEYGTYVDYLVIGRSLYQYKSSDYDNLSNYITTKSTAELKKHKTNKAVIELYFNENFKDTNSIEILKSYNQPNAQEAFNQHPTPQFFLPFSINIEMDGISGIRLFDSFKTSNNIFPSYYRSKNISLIVGSQNHSITPKSWTTTISAIPSPIK